MGVRGTPLARVSSNPFSGFGDQVSPHVHHERTTLSLEFGNGSFGVYSFRENRSRSAAATRGPPRLRVRVRPDPGTCGPVA